MPALCQVYLDYVRARAMGGILLVEQRVDLSKWLGPGQGGTADTIIILPEQRRMIIVDLKYGQGEQVYAEKNAQMLCYALGALELAQVFCEEIEVIEMVICQPRLYHIDTWECHLSELEHFSLRAMQAVADCGAAMIQSLDNEYAALLPYLDPADKTCRWCQAKAVCPALARKVAEEVGREFIVVEADAPTVPQDSELLSRAMNAVPLIEQWAQAVRHEVNRRVREGIEVIGSDGKPYKIVEGRKGKRAWIDEAAAEAELQLVLTPDKIYKPAPIITAPAAKKLLGKKATLAMWREKFEPLIKQTEGKPQIVLGSDPRPPYAGASTGDDFDEIGAPEDVE